MLRICLTAAFCLFGVAAPVSIGFGQKKLNPKLVDKKDVRSFAHRLPRAKNIDFGKQLNLPFKSLETLGSRIDKARDEHDPVALAHAAGELDVAEKVSGKKAELTSKTLLNQAVELAKLRQQAPELRATLHVAKQINQDATAISNLQKMIKRADDITQEDVSGDTVPKGISTPVFIKNKTGQWVSIYVNGSYNLRIPPFKGKWCFARNLRPTVLTAVSTSYYWPPRYVWGTFSMYTWELVGLKERDDN